MNPLSLNYNDFTKYSIKMTIGRSFICWAFITCIIFFILKIKLRGEKS